MQWVTLQRAMQAATETPAAFDDEMAPLRQGVQHPSHADEPMPAIAQQHTPSRATHKQEDAAAAHEGRQAVLAAPAVRKLAKDKGVNLAQLQGTGPSARITRGAHRSYQHTFLQWRV